MAVGVMNEKGEVKDHNDENKDNFKKVMSDYKDAKSDHPDKDHIFLHHDPKTVDQDSKDPEFHARVRATKDASGVLSITTAQVDPLTSGDVDLAKVASLTAGINALSMPGLEGGDINLPCNSPEDVAAWEKAIAYYQKIHKKDQCGVSGKIKFNVSAGVTAPSAIELDENKPFPGTEKKAKLKK